MQPRDELNAKIRRDEPAPQEIHVRHGEADVRVKIRTAGPVGCSLDELEVRSPGLGEPDAPRKACEQIEESVKYLQEPLKILENGPDGEVQMRSQEPQRSGDARRYNELDADRTRLRLKRFGKQPGETRKSEPLDVTHETLHRLVDDLVEATRQ